MVSGDIFLRGICVAHGSVSFVRARHIPLVSSLAAAIFNGALDAAARCLDGVHYPNIRPMALALLGTSLGSTSGLGNAAGIRMLDSHCGDYRLSPDPSVEPSAVLNGVNDTGHAGPKKSYVSGSLTPSSYMAFVKFTEERLYEKCLPFHPEGSPA